MKYIILLLPFQAAMAATIDVSFDGFYPLFTVRDTYLSFNIDTGSLHNDMDFQDPMLVQLVRLFACHYIKYMRIKRKDSTFKSYVASPALLPTLSDDLISSITIIIVWHWFTTTVTYIQAKNLVAAGPTQLRMGKSRYLVSIV